MSNPITTAYKNTVIKFPLLVLLAVLTVIGFMGSHLPNVKLDASSDSLVLEGDESLAYFREISKLYQSEDFLLVAYQPEDDLMSDKVLDDLQALRDELAALPEISSVISILDVPLLESPPVAMSDLTSGQIPQLRSPQTDRELARKEFATSPFYKSLLTSPDGSTTAIQASIKRDTKYVALQDARNALREKARNGELDAEGEAELAKAEEIFQAYSAEAAERSAQLVETVRGILPKYRDDAKVYLGGVPMIAADMISFVENDLVVFGTGILVFIVLLLLVIFRSITWTLLPLTTCLLTVVFMLGLLGFLDWNMTVISANFVALLLIITLAVTIHLVVRYRELSVAQPGASQQDLVMQTVSIMAIPCVYTTLTTLIAFVSLVVSGIRPVMDFGWMMSIGATAALVMAFLVFPTVLMLLPKPSAGEATDNSQGLTMKFAAIAERFSPAIFAVSLGVLLLSAIGISQLKVENRFIDYFHESTEIYQGMEIIDEELGGTISPEVILDLPKMLGGGQDQFGGDDFSSSGSNDFGSDDFGSNDFGSNDFANTGSGSGGTGFWFTVTGLERISEVHEYLDSLPETGKVLSLATGYDIVKMVLGGSVDDLTLKLIEGGLPPEIKGVLVDSYYKPEIDQARIVARVKETSRTLQRNELLEQIHDHLTNEMGFAEEEVHLTGLLVMYNNMLQSLFKSQILTLGTVFVAILIMFLFLFRSLKFALVALAPNLLAAGAVLGSMGLIGIPLDIMTITIAAITVGIGVDHAIHYVHRFRKEFPVDRDYIATMYRCHGSIGKAMYYTSVIIIFGFSILALSNFNPSIYFGLLTAGAMLASLLGSMLLLPRLIILVKPMGEASA